MTTHIAVRDQTGRKVFGASFIGTILMVQDDGTEVEAEPVLV